MKGKFKYRLSPKLAGVLRIDLDIPERVREIAEANGHSKEELENLIGQEFQVIVELLALDEQS